MPSRCMYKYNKGKNWKHRRRPLVDRGCLFFDSILCSWYGVKFIKYHFLVTSVETCGCNIISYPYTPYTLRYVLYVQYHSKKVEIAQNN